MNWYYGLNGVQQGPVDQAALDELLARGTVTADTLVWTEGMSEWKPLGQIRASSATPPVVTSISGTVCSHCGQSFGPDDLIQINGRPVCAACKPRVLQSLQEGAPTNLESERIRREHIAHEASIKSVGVLYLLGAILLLPIGLFGLVAGVAGVNQSGGGFTRLLALVLLGMGLFQLFAGLGLRKLKGPARIAAAVIAGIGLIGFPLGTLINGYILYLLFSKKGATIFSDSYQQIVAETPHIIYKTSVVVWVILGILLVVIIGGIILFAVR